MTPADSAAFHGIGEAITMLAGAFARGFAYALGALLVMRTMPIRLYPIEKPRATPPLESRGLPKEMVTCPGCRQPFESLDPRPNSRKRG